MLRDVLVASIYRGQFPPALIGLVVLAITLKMPAEDLTKVVFHFVSLLERHELLGYVLAGLCAASWFAHARSQRRLIGEERAALKAMVLDVQRKSNEVHP
jgi:hypothetical protein